MIKNFKTTVNIFSIAMIFFFLNPVIFVNLAFGNTDFMKALSMFVFDKKHKAQNFILRDLNGNQVSLVDHRGKIVFLNFWATWCPPCRIEMPSMEKLHNRFKNDDFIILAIDLQENREQVKRFKERFKLTFTILLDSDGKVGATYGIRSIPATYLVDRNGYLIGGALGARDWASDDAFQLFEHLLEEPMKP
ncbi:MAG: TlpA family protein disulfide reductase [Desulfobacterales bacterium]